MAASPTEHEHLKPNRVISTSQDDKTETGGRRRQQWQYQARWISRERPQHRRRLDDGGSRCRRSVVGGHVGTRRCAVVARSFDIVAAAAAGRDKSVTMARLVVSRRRSNAVHERPTASDCAERRWPVTLYCNKKTRRQRPLSKIVPSGRFRGKPSRLRPLPSLGDGLTPSLTVLLTCDNGTILWRHHRHVS